MESLEKIKQLISLAAIDGEVTESEKQYIINIGQANHLLVSEILPLFSSAHSLIVPENLSDDQKFEYILHLMQLMKIDTKLFRPEILYCARVIAKLGYREQVLFELLEKVSADMTKDEINSLKKITATYLRK